MKKLLTILVKDPKKSKSRLSCVLSLKERATLTKMMLLDILRKIDFSFFDEIFILTDAPQYYSFLRDKFSDLTILEDRFSNINKSLYFLGLQALKFKIDELWIIPSDIPLLKWSDLYYASKFVNKIRKGIVITPSYNDGTNLLIMKPPNVIRTHFGRNSFYKHITAARKRNLQCIIYRNSRIKYDLDVPYDILKIMETGKNIRIKRFLEGIGLFERLALLIVER